MLCLCVHFNVKHVESRHECIFVNCKPGHFMIFFCVAEAFDCCFEASSRLLFLQNNSVSTKIITIPHHITDLTVFIVSPYSFHFLVPMWVKKAKLYSVKHSVHEVYAIAFTQTNKKCMCKERECMEQMKAYRQTVYQNACSGSG